MSKTPQELLEAEVEKAQNRRRAALCTIDHLAADHGVVLPAIDDEPYPCNRIALLVRAIAARADKAEAALVTMGDRVMAALAEREQAEAALRQSEAEVARMIAVVGRASQYRKQAEATLLRVNAALARNIDYQEKVHAVIAALRDTTPGQFRV